MASSLPKNVLVVTPGCPPGLIKEVLEDQNLLNRTELVVLPPAPRFHYSHLLDETYPPPGPRFLTSPARNFFSIRHLKWLRGFLNSSRDVVVLVPKELYQAPEVSLASLLILGMSDSSITILRNHGHQGAPALNTAAVLGANGAEEPRKWVSFDFDKRMISLELGRLIWIAVQPVWQGRWGFLYLLMLLGLLLKERYQTMLPNKFKTTSLQGRNSLGINFSKAAIIVAPECPSRMIQELLEDDLLPVNTLLEVLLPPGNHSAYANLADRKTPSGEVRFVPSPARKFFSFRNLAWIRGKLQSSEQNFMLVPKPPSQDLSLALASPLISVLSAGTLTILRPFTAGDITEQLELGMEPGDHYLTARWIKKKLNLDLFIMEIGNLAWAAYPAFLKKFFEFTESELCFYFDAYPSQPVNLQPLDTSPEGIAGDVTYALNTADNLIKSLPGGVGYLKGKRVMEIGSGVNFGTILTIACYGAEVTAVERYSPPWNRDYHSKFYTLLRDRLAQRGAIDLTPLDMIVSRQEYPQGSITVHSCSLEELQGVPGHSIDLVFSNAVFEHLYNLKSAFEHLARITKPGGLGIHQVDFRDHRNPSRPLEHLLLSNREFSRVFKEKHSECGNRYRPKEMQQFLEAAGFEVVKFNPDIDVEEEYLQDFLVRLRQARRSRYRRYDAESLRHASGLLIMVRKPA